MSDAGGIGPVGDAGCALRRRVQSDQPCATGTPGCASAAPAACVARNAPAGQACGAGFVCDGNGMCATCNAGAACSSQNQCHTGALSCASGAPVCVDTDNKVDGTRCALGDGGTSDGVCENGSQGVHHGRRLRAHRQRMPQGQDRQL